MTRSCLSLSSLPPQPIPLSHAVADRSPWHELRQASLIVAVIPPSSLSSSSPLFLSLSSLDGFLSPLLHLASASTDQQPPFVQLLHAPARCTDQRVLKPLGLAWWWPNRGGGGAWRSRVLMAVERRPLSSFDGSSCS